MGKPADMKKFAEEVHALLCTANHIDGCSWTYEADESNWTREHTAKSYWLGKAYRLRQRWPGIVAEDIQKALIYVRELRSI